MKRTIGIVMILLMLMSVTVAWAGVDRNTQPDKTDAGLGLQTAMATHAGAGAGQGTGGGNAAAAPEMERGMFVNRPLASPVWYPDDCVETDSYRWAPKFYWAEPSEVEVKVNPMASLEGNLGDVVAEVAKGFDAWNDVATGYTATVSRDDNVGPSLEDPDKVNTVSWGTIDGPGGIIAVTNFWYYVQTKELVDCDIIFDTAEPWSIATTVPGGSFDVWNIATHEAGHTLVLADLYSPKDGALTMHAYTWPGDGMKRELGAGDTLGIQEIYGT